MPETYLDLMFVSVSEIDTCNNSNSVIAHLFHPRGAVSALDAPRRPAVSPVYDRVATIDLEPRDTPDLTLSVAGGLACGTTTRSGDAVRWSATAPVRAPARGDLVVLEGSGHRAAYRLSLAGWERTDLPDDLVTIPSAP